MSKTRISVYGDDARSIPLSMGLLLYVPSVLLANQLGLLLRYPENGSSVLFMSYAVLTAVLVVSDWRHWIWYLMAGVAAHLFVHWPQWSLTWILVANAANVARAVTAAVLIRRFLGFPPRLDSIRALGLYILAAALLAPAVGATIGAANVLLHPVEPTYWPTWSAWFMSNALTGLTLLPALMLALANRDAWSRWRGHERIAEAIVLGLALVVSAVLPRVGSIGALLPPGILFYSPLPVLIWAALRFGAGGATAALTAVTYAAVWGAFGHSEPLGSASPDERLLMLQLFVLLTAIPVLCIAVTSSAKHAVVQLHRALLASLHDHIAIIDGRGVVLEVNQAWRRFAESPDVPPYKRVLTGENYLDTLTFAAERGDDGAARVLLGVRSVLNRIRNRFEVEYDLDRLGRQERYQLSVEAFERADGGVILRRTDLTARRQAQLEVEEQRRVLTHLARVSVLGQLSGALAHELNQPLASIASNAQAAQILLKRRPPDLGELDAILGDIVADDARASRVIRGLVALLRRGEARLQATDATELLDDALELSRTELITRKVTATASVAPDVPPVLADRVQLQQVLLNLVLNACEAMNGEGSGDRRLELIVRNESRNTVRFSVCDNGSGIPPRQLERLFEPFVTTKAEGMGLGLSMSRTIISAHGGRMWAENNAHRGATVHFILTVARAAEREGEIGRGIAAEVAPLHGGTVASQEAVAMSVTSTTSA
jgi:two-component system, LuxR family, sensor kinase FixL